MNTESVIFAQQLISWTAPVIVNLIEPMILDLKNLD